MADRIVVIDYSFSFSVKKAVKLYVAIFFSVKKKEETVIPSWTIQCGLYHQPRPQGFSLNFLREKPWGRGCYITNRCYRPECLWGILFKMATTAIVKKTI